MRIGGEDGSRPKYDKHTHIYIYIYIYIRRTLLVRGHQAAKDIGQTDSSKSLKSFNHQLTVRFFSPFQSSSLQLQVYQSGICF